MPRLVWADASADRMFIEAVLNTPDRPALDFVADGEELLRLCNPARADLIVLDLDLPTVGGLEVLSQLKARGNTVPVVVFSKASPPTVDACYLLGAARVIQKPQEFRDFRNRVQQVCAMSGRGAVSVAGR